MYIAVICKATNGGDSVKYSTIILIILIIIIIMIIIIIIMITTIIIVTAYNNYWIKTKINNSKKRNRQY